MKRYNAISTQLAEKHFNKALTRACIIHKAQHFCPEAINDLFHFVMKSIKTVIAERIGLLVRVIYYTESVINSFFKCRICFEVFDIDIYSHRGCFPLDFLCS